MTDIKQMEHNSVSGKAKFYSESGAFLFEISGCSYECAAAFSRKIRQAETWAREDERRAIKERVLNAIERCL